MDSVQDAPSAAEPASACPQHPIQTQAFTSDAFARGIDIRGMFHWTSVDNYEWHHGYHVPFGLIDRDRNIRASARILSREARRARQRASFAMSIGRHSRWI